MLYYPKDAIFRVSGGSTKRKENKMIKIQETNSKFRIEVGRDVRVFRSLKEAKKFLRLSKIYKFQLAFDRRAV